MQTWMISRIVFCAVGLASPAILLVVAWRRNRPVATILIIPSLAIVVLTLAMIPEMRLVLVGADNTRRLYVTIGAFAALTLANAIYAAFRKAWIVALASAVISLAWLFVGVVNSVV